MILLAGYLDVLSRALVFIGLALSVGGLVFRYLVLRPTVESSELGETAQRRTVTLIVCGAFLVAGAQALSLFSAVASLSEAAGYWPFAAFFSTGFAVAGVIRVGFGLGFAVAALRLRNRIASRSAWAVTSAFAAAVMVSGAWLTHGASRLDYAYSLMAVTVIHELAAVTWIGGLVHLTVQWRVFSGSPASLQLWPRLLGRFSPMALCGVGLLVATGGYLYWRYIDTLRGLIGTAYGTMLVTKIALMASAVLLGGISNLTIRYWKLTGERGELVRRLPAFAEVEAMIGVIILMAAAALTGQPPSVDVPNQQATPAEVMNVFAAKDPQLTPPPHDKMLAGANSSLDPYALPSRISRIQSDFNHNISGILVILVGVAAFLSKSTKLRAARHWPLLFLLLALFLIVIGEPNGWPLGPEPFWKTLIAPDVLQHRLATLLVIVLALVQWRVQVGALGRTRWRYLFPLLCIFGGTLLLTHSHSVFAIKRTFLIEASHNAIGILAVLMGSGAWLEARLPGREGRIGGIVWPICLTLIGVVLLFYRET